MATRHTPMALALLLAAVLAGCALPGSDDVTVKTGPAHAAAPAPTATPVPWMGAPHSTPPGWQVYHAPEFALALPADWWVYVDVGLDSTLPTRRVGYSLFSPQQDHRGTVFVWDQLTAAQVHDDFCADVSTQVPDTFAGLPMRYTTGDGNAAAFERIWTFISSRGVVYQLWTDDGPDGNVAGDRENRAVLETFAPEYTTWGCA
jgi:hypothetical protein